MIFKIIELTKYFLLGLIIVAFIIILRLFVVDLYRIPSNSMEPTIQSGDYILVSKLAYGSRVVKVWKLLVDKKLEYYWNGGIGTVQKGDVIVFNQPVYITLSGEYPNFYGSPFVKRCYSMPEDTVVISNKDFSINDEAIKVIQIKGISSKKVIDKPNHKKIHQVWQSELFPQDSTLGWTLSNYGPLLVPGNGVTIQLTSKSALHYRDVLKYEGYDAAIHSDSALLNGTYATSYTFKENYYFMLGDNFYNSKDSRYWGFVPQKNIIGKAVLVLFSLDPYEPWYRKFKWSRFLKRIR